jgi:hypothetical protein
MSQPAVIPYTIHNDKNAVFCKMQQGVSFENIYQHTLELMADKNYRPGLNGFYDFTSVDKLSGDKSIWHSLAKGISSNELLPIHCSVAIVVSDLDNQTSHQLKEFIALTKEANIHYKLFNEQSIEDAYAHIKLNDAALLTQIAF